jgi:hypothetical protein
MREYTLLTTTSLEVGVPWINHGVILRPSTRFPSTDYTNQKMLAPGVVYNNGWFYLYFPHSQAIDGAHRIEVGVARSRSPTNPATWELVTGSISNLRLFDPAVMVAPDGRIYLYGSSHEKSDGATRRRMQAAELDRSSLSRLQGSLRTIYGGSITEAVYAFWRRFYNPRLRRTVVKYYFMARSQIGRDAMQYWMADTPLPSIPRKNRGMRLTYNQFDAPAHASVLEYKTRYYLFYHSGAENSGSKWRRSPCMDEIFFEADGRIKAPVHLTCMIRSTP